MTFERPVCIRAVVIAIRFASVPEFVNRTRSRPNRAHISSANCRSYGWIPPTLASWRMASSTASSTRRSLWPKSPAV